MQRFPKGMRPSKLEERQAFYRCEFDVRALGRWVGHRNRSLKFAMIPGRHTGIVPSRHASVKDDVVIIDEWSRARDIRDYALEYLPEGLYYDRNRYKDVRECARCGDKPKNCRGCYNYDGQQLAFDLDPENVDCPWHGHIGEKFQRGQGFSFCMYEFKSVRRQALLLSEELGNRYERIDIVYSGRGFHVVVDDEDAYGLSKRARKELARQLAKRYAIDEWVTEGGSRLMRLPYSLNGLVSRKCTIIKQRKDLVEFDPRISEMVVPRFLHSP
ncbi:MAG TPA: DNA primase [Thermoplasmata archaeon]